MAAPRKLTAKWQLDAALLSRPVDLTALVSMSLTDPEAFFDDDTLHRMVKILLNESNERRSTHSTKLSVLTILANLAKDPTSKVKDEVKMVLGGVSEWFDEYLQAEPVGGSDAKTGVPLEPEMHKTMLLVLCRCYDYALQTEDLFELSGNNKATALVTVVALLEEGETYTTALTQRRGPAAAAGSASAEKGPAQWEKQLVIERYERPLVLQLCRLLQGFTHPSTYFQAEKVKSGGGSGGHGDDDDEDVEDEEEDDISVGKFSAEINSLLSLTLRSQLLEKLTQAMHDCLFDFEDDDDDDEDDERGSGDNDEDDEEKEGWQEEEEAKGEGEGKEVDRQKQQQLSPPSRKSTTTTTTTTRMSKSEKRRERALLLDSHEHGAVSCVNQFLQNLSLYGTDPILVSGFQHALLCETTLIARLLLPYLGACVLEARLLSSEQKKKKHSHHHLPHHHATPPRSSNYLSLTSTTPPPSSSSLSLSGIRTPRGETSAAAPSASSSSSSSSSCATPTSMTPRLEQQQQQQQVLPPLSSGIGGGGASGHGGGRQLAALAAGVCATLKTLVMATFRAPPTRGMLTLLKQVNPTSALLRASAFCAEHPTLFALVCLLNVNMNSLDLTLAAEGGGAAAVKSSKSKARRQRRRRGKHSGDGGGDRARAADDDDLDAADDIDNEDDDHDDDDDDDEDEDDGEELLRSYQAHALVHDLTMVHGLMTVEAQVKVLTLILGVDAHGLPLARDVPSYQALLSLLGKGTDFESFAESETSSLGAGRNGARQQRVAESKGIQSNGGGVVGAKGGIVRETLQYDAENDGGFSSGGSGRRRGGGGGGGSAGNGRGEEGDDEDGDDEDDDEVVGRAQAKSAASARLERARLQQQHQQQQQQQQEEEEEDGVVGRGGGDGGDGGGSGCEGRPLVAESKEVDNTSDDQGTTTTTTTSSKESPPPSLPSPSAKGVPSSQSSPPLPSPSSSSQQQAGNRFRLLGDLPSLTESSSSSSSVPVVSLVAPALDKGLAEAVLTAKRQLTQRINAAAAATKHHGGCVGVSGGGGRSGSSDGGGCQSGYGEAKHQHHNQHQQQQHQLPATTTEALLASLSSLHGAAGLNGNQSSSSGGGSSGVAAAAAAAAAAAVPAELCCAINGHVMKDPVVSPHGVRFEAATIRLWLSSRGSVCPITQKNLREEELTVDSECRIKITRWQIRKQQRVRRNAGSAGAGHNSRNSDDDSSLYDF